MPRPRSTERVDELLEVVRLDRLRPAQARPALRRPAAARGAGPRAGQLPKALLLDEPLGALDLKLRHVMQFELKRIQREVGITFVYVTHDQEEALTMSDRIAVMNAGKVEQIGTPTEIYDRPATVFVAGFIGQANLWPATGRGPRRRHRRGRRPRRRAVPRHLPRARGRRPATACSWSAPSGSRSPSTSPRPTLGRCGRRSPTSRSRARSCGSSSTAPDGSPIVAHLDHDADLPFLRPGDEVWASWSPTAACVLPAAPDLPLTDDEIVEEG